MFAKSLFSALVVLSLTAAKSEAETKTVWVDPAAPQQNGQILLGFMGHFNGQGMHVDGVTPGSIAHRIGLERYDVVVAVNGQQVYSHAHYLQLLRTSGGHISLTVRNWRNGQFVYLNASVSVPSSHACAQCQ